MSDLTSERSGHSADRGVNTFEDNEAGDDARQFITCQPKDLLTAKKNKAAKNSLQCLGPMESDTTRQVSRDFSLAGDASIDVRQAGSRTRFKGTGRTLHVVEEFTTTNGTNS